MDIRQLLAADSYAEGHVTRIIRNLILRLATSEVSQADALQQAWSAGYAAREEEENKLLIREKPLPSVISEAEARQLLRDSGLPNAQMRTRGGRAWSWLAEQGGWLIEDDDCLVRPGAGGLMLIEAGSDGGGTVLIMPGARSIDFPFGTFR